MGQKPHINAVYPRMRCSGHHKAQILPQGRGLKPRRLQLAFRDNPGPGYPSIRSIRRQIGKLLERHGPWTV